MKLDNTDYKIILEALYQLAMLDPKNISSEHVASLDEQELEDRLLKLRREYSFLEKRSRFED